MATDMFIKIDKIPGEAKGAGHEGQIDVLAWSWGMSNSGSAHAGPGSGSGKANFQDLSFTKYVDKASAVLMGHCAKGTHIASADLYVQKAGDKPVEYIKITLNQVLVTSLSTGGSGGEDRLTENVTLNFAKFAIDYKGQKADGSAEAAVKFGFDISVNKAV